MSAELSQDELAEMAGLTSQHISHTEVASTKISLSSLAKNANILHTSVNRLLSDSIHDSKAYLMNDVNMILLAVTLMKCMSCYSCQEVY